MCTHLSVFLQTVGAVSNINVLAILHIAYNSGNGGLYSLRRHLWRILR